MKQQELNTEYKGITIIHLLNGHEYIVKDIIKKEIPNSWNTYQYVKLYGDFFREKHRYSEVNHRFSKIYPNLKSIKSDIDSYRLINPYNQLRTKDITEVLELNLN